MKNEVRIFLGSNSGKGFYSLYDQLLHGRLRDLLIIKGGPGCGKSSFMRAAAKTLAEAGEEVVYVNCSGDPDSLDAVLFPRLKSGMVDGTAPHALEPSYTVAAERYLDLTRFYDVEKTKSRREEIVRHSDAYREAYAEAYHILRAVDALESERRAILRRGADWGRAERRIASAAARELRGASGREGGADRAFLGGMTHQGELCRFASVDALCPRVYVLEDSYGMAAGALAAARDAAVAAGCRVLACPNPDRPDELAHLLVPERGFALVTSTNRLPYPDKPYRRLRLDALAEKQLTGERKAKLRLSARVQRTLREEAVEALGRAKASHDALEAAYNPCVDFDGVYALAEREARRLQEG